MSVEIKNLKEYINFPNTTSTFKKLIGKYHMKKKDSEKHNRKLLLKKIEAKIQELENDEKENDYIVNEVRRNAQLNKEILYSFGTKALNHIDEIRKLNVTSKIDKSKFFEPEKENNIYQVTDFNNKRFKSLNTKYNRNKIINLPKINLKSRNIKNDVYKKANDNISINKKTEYSIDNKNESQNKKSKINFSIDFKDKNGDILDIISPKKESLQNLSLFYNKSPLTTERESNDLKNNILKKKPIVIDSDYINYIQEIKSKFLRAEKKQERYFDNYKHGYDAFKLKYNYLKKKYFD
jgi:hypothetical protein